VALSTTTVPSLAFAPTGNVLAAGCRDPGGSEPYQVQFYDLTTGAIRPTQGGHTNAIVRVAFSLDGTLLASGDASGIVKLWDMATGAELREMLGHSADITTMAFSPDGATLASGDWHGTVVLWNVGAAP
jgi:WD40 repeat protein